MHRLLDVESLGLDPSRAALLREIFELHSQVHDQALAIAGPMPMPAELTMQQFRVLGFIVKDPGMTGHELGVSLGVSAPTASGLVDRLVEKGLLERADDATDRRIRRLHITEEGMALTRQLDSLLQRAMIEVIKNTTVEDLEIMRASAVAMLSAMERTLRDR
ncbi:MAG TPA: MarR family transcriptional regulator [Propionicimonas sp.]|nr:MarR family transcriptional regulator [Propionicimonas sp.]